jgi:NAD(P)-dependent dehydrogenase (short-subunit alcohol dehydrogenase family)
MTITDRVVLVTGANRGIGRALRLDITDAEQVRRAVEQLDVLDVLVNNAGIAIYDDLSDPAVVEQHLEHIYASVGRSAA